MPGQVRCDKKAMKIAYKILKTPKDQQQIETKPTAKQLKEWFRDSSAAQ